LISNKLILTLLDILARQNETGNEIKSNKEGPRYFAVETARGYIIINREYKFINLFVSHCYRWSFFLFFSFLVSKINLKERIYYRI